MKLNSLFIIIGLFTGFLSSAQINIAENPAAGLTLLSSSANPTIIYVDSKDYPLVRLSAELLSQDLKRVTGEEHKIVHSIPANADKLIIVGSLDRSSSISQLIRTKKINTAKIKGRWEAFQLTMVANPFKGIKEALVINGNDRRGTAYGVFELSAKLGVSPWYWWADVPVDSKKSIYINRNVSLSDYPRVKYRGIFINDEAPALSGWTKEKFGGFNHKFYEHVFELMLRLKANYLWPAMWGNAFYDDDSLSINSAEKYGIVIGTSHHEPLMRAHDEWRRYGTGKWNYDSNEVRLKEFWRAGMKRATNEKIVSVGMRGDGDEPMSRETATALLERIVADQRKIIADVTKKPVTETPQLWALYKEVQDYYDKGMRVPDDVTLLLCDDNWGNIRRLPKLNEKPRKGGYGIYYHFDYVGGPRNYKWLNTNSIPRVWEQMHLAWEYNAREIWIVNVGDIKPMEFPISFFLDYAWNPSAIRPNDLQNYTRNWAATQFGEANSKEIAEIISKYTKYNSRRKPELLDAKTYSVGNYNELSRVTKEWLAIENMANRIEPSISNPFKDAYNQLVLHPVYACSNLQQMYFAVANNHEAYRMRSEATNGYATLARNLFIKDSVISDWYNHGISEGKWNHFMDQTHIGYTYWQQPPVQVMPKVFTLPPDSVIESARVIVDEEVRTAAIPKNVSKNSYQEVVGYVSIEAAEFTNATNTNEVKWTILPDHGKTGDAVTTFPVTSKSVVPGTTSPKLEYEIYVYDTGKVAINAYFSPTLNIQHTATGLQYAISIDDEKPQIISINKEDDKLGIWNKWVADNIIIKTSQHRVLKSGKHIVRYWMVDPCVVLQKLVLDFGGLELSYLGPPSTKIK